MYTHIRAYIYAYACNTYKGTSRQSSQVDALIQTTLADHLLLDPPKEKWSGLT